MDLVSKSRLGFRSDQKNFEKIQRWFMQLNGHSMISKVLKVVANAGQLDIVFDFNRNSIEEMDPTATNNVTARTYHKQGHILIASGLEEETQVLGVLAQELTHYAMQLVYNNKCLPFHRNDKERQDQFKDIAVMYSVTQDSVLRKVYECYDECWDEVLCELIARVPQLVAMHLNDSAALEAKRQEFNFLFSFFEERVEPDLCVEAGMIKAKCFIRATNRDFGLFAKSLQEKLSTKYLEKFKVPEKAYIKTPVPGLVLENIVMKLQKEGMDIDSKYIFVEFDQMSISKSFEKLKKAADSVAEPIIFIKDTAAVSSEPIKGKLLDFLTDLKVVFISNVERCELEQILQPVIVKTYKWNNLSEEFQSKILHSKFKFQDNEISLKDIEDNESILQGTPIELLCEPWALKFQGFDEKLPSAPRVFIERTFLSAPEEKNELTPERPVFELPPLVPGRATAVDGENINFEQVEAMISDLTNLFNQIDSLKEKIAQNKAEETVNSSYLCNLLLNRETVVIADTAGMGKSTSAVEIARKLNKSSYLYWITYIDLKHHTKVFKRRDQVQFENVDPSQSEQIYSEFSIKKLLKFENVFEEKLFENFFSNGNAVFIVDGFDEVSPNYNRLVTRLLLEIKFSRNRLLVATRSHLAAELEESLETKAFKMMPFSTDEQIEFLRAYCLQPNVEVTIDNLLEKHRKLHQRGDFLEVPIHIFMMAELFNGPELGSFDDIEFNMYTLYKRFIHKKINIWIRKGPLALEDNTEIQMSTLTVMLFHQKLALEYFFGKELIEEIGFDEFPKTAPSHLTSELISRVGLVTEHGEAAFEFAHMTFAEFLAVEFACISRKKLLSPNEVKHSIFVKFLEEGIYRHARIFMNCKLELNEAFEIEALKDQVEKAVVENSNRGLLELMIKEKHTRLMTFVLKTFQLNSEVKQMLVKSIWIDGSHPYESLKAIWNCIDIGDSESLDFFLERLRNFDLTSLIKILSEEDKDQILRICEAVELKFEDFDFIWNSIEERLDIGEQKIFLKKKLRNGETIFHALAVQSKLQTVLLWLKTLQRVLPRAELESLMLEKSKYGNLFTHRAARQANSGIFTELWMSVTEKASKATQESLVLCVNKTGRTMLSEALDNVNSAIVKLVYEITCPILKAKGKNFGEFLQEQDGLSDFILSTVEWSSELFLDFSLNMSDEEFGKVLLGEGRKEKSPIGRKTLCLASFKSTDECLKKENVLHILIQNPKQAETQILWSRVCACLDKLQMKKMLFEVDAEHGIGNVFYHAVANNNRLIIDILTWYKNNFDPEELRKVFLEGNSWKTTPTHILAERSDETLAREYLEFVLKNLSPSEQQELFLLEDSHQRIPLARALKRIDVAEVFWDFYCRAIEKEKMEVIFLGSTFIGCLVNNLPLRSVMFFKVLLIEKLGDEKVENVFRRFNFTE